MRRSQPGCVRSRLMSSPGIDQEAFQRFEHDGWEEKATGYHRYFTEVSRHNIEPLLDAAGVRPGSRVLDIGTGPGMLAAAAAARAANVIGFDMSEEMVSLARQLHPGLTFEQGLADRLPCSDGQFDAVVGNLLLPHLPDPDGAMRELTRVLAPGGRLALSMWSNPAASRFLGIVLDAVAFAKAPPVPGIPAGPPPWRFSDEKELRDLFSRAGLREVEVRTVAFRQPVESADALWEAMLTGTVRTASLVAGQPDEVRGRIRASFDELVRPYRTGDGLQIPVSFKIASGKKAAQS